MRIINFLKENEDERYGYIRGLYAKEDKLLKSIREDLIEDNKPININPEEGKLLQLLIKMNRIKTIVEIGTLYGYSTIWMARALSDSGKIYTIEKDEDSHKIAKYNFIKAGVENKVEAINHYALKALNDLNDTYDMVFIDAQKNEYLQYVQWAEQHIKKSGLIVLDNTFLSGAVYMDKLPENVKESTKLQMMEVNNYLANEEKFYTAMLPTNEGFTIVVKRF